MGHAPDFSFVFQLNAHPHRAQYIHGFVRICGQFWQIFIRSCDVVLLAMTRPSFSVFTTLMVALLHCAAP